MTDEPLTKPKDDRAGWVFYAPSKVPVSVYLYVMAIDCSRVVIS